MVMQRQELRIQQQHALFLTQEVRQSIQVLQLSIEELKEWLEERLELLPNLEKESSCEEYAHQKTSLEIPYQPQLFEQLMEQARLELNETELRAAEWIIGNLDERGFYSLPVTQEQLPVLRKIQSFGPPGIAARDLKECLLIQLEIKEKRVAHKLVCNHLEDLLHNRLEKIVKKMGCSLAQLKEIVKRDILSLDFWPAARFSSTKIPILIPDVIVDHRNKECDIRVNEELLPTFSVSSDPLNLASHLHEKTLYLHSVRTSRGLIEAIERRKCTLEKIVHYLVQEMPAFFEGINSYPEPLTMKDVAEELGLHVSTIARAVSGKYLQCDQGIFPLRFFFSSSTHNEEGKAISNKQAKHVLKALIQAEDCTLPLSDEALSEAMAIKGIPCARRTVTKYRKLLKIPTAAQRRKGRKAGANANSFYT